MVTRSLKESIPEDRKRIPAPRYGVFGDSMLNCEWGNENPWEKWRDGWASDVHALNGTLVISLSGRDIDGCVCLIKALEQQAHAFEINVSCSHSGVLHGDMNRNVKHLQKLMRTIRPVTTKPIWLKLSHSPMLISMAQEAEGLGADAIVTTNSIGPGILIDTKTGLQKLGSKGGVGGVTGPAIFPIELRCVYELAKAVSIPIVGVGGIKDTDTTIQMLMAGASAVQLYTVPALKGPIVFRRITQGLRKYLNEHQMSLSDLIGFAHRRQEQFRFSAPAPQVIEEDCTACGLCKPSCAFDAIRFVRRNDTAVVVIDNNVCTGCNACVGVCPPEYDALIPKFSEEEDYA